MKIDKNTVEERETSILTSRAALAGSMRGWKRENKQEIESAGV